MAKLLPIAACELDAQGMRDQRDRYRRLAPTVSRIGRENGTLVVEFGEQLDEHLLDETVTVEQGCCSFFGFDYDTDRRRLVVSVANPDQQAGLDTLHEALTARPRA
jgi:hypothetical protein